MSMLLSTKELEQIVTGFRYITNINIKVGINNHNTRTGKRGRKKNKNEYPTQTANLGLDPVETIINTIKERLEYVSQYKTFSKPEELSTALQILKQVECLINLLHDYNALAIK